MDRRDFVATIGAAVIGATAGCLGGDGETTTTTTTTDTTTTTGYGGPHDETIGTPTETTTQTTQPTTHTPEGPDVSVSLASIEPADRVVRDGVATVVARVTNQGGPGEERVTVTLDRRGGDRYTYETDTVLALGANETTSVTLRADFNATGTYDVRVNGTQVGTVSVRSLGHTNWNPPEDEDTDPTIEVVATGSVVAR